MGLEDLPTVLSSAGGSLAGAFLAFRVALNALDDRVRSNSKRLNIHGERLDQHGNRISIVETRLTFRKND